MTNPEKEEEKALTLPEGFDMRYTELSDAPFLKEWLTDPSVATWFPMDDPIEIDDAVSRWIGFYRYRCSLTATVNGVPCGIATLYLQPYRKLAHQCEFGIIVSPQYRNHGIGSDLIKNLTHLAKNVFRIELLHLQVYAKNPAMNLYKRHGFVEFGNQTKWIKERDGTYVGRIFMEKLI